MTGDADGSDEIAGDAGGCAAIHDESRVPAPCRPRPRASTVCALLAALVVVGDWSGLLLVVAGRVIPGWALSGALLVAALALKLAARRRARRSSEVAAQARATAWPGSGSWGQPVVVVATMMATAGSGLSAAADLSASYHVLAPEAPGGCRAAVREESFLFAGRGAVYAVSVVGIGWRTGKWTADDGYRPIESGTYELSWSDDGGVLRVGGRGGDPVWPALHEVDCGWFG